MPRIKRNIEIATIDNEAIAIGKLYAEARRSQVDSVLHLAECGKRLAARKAQLKHGKWLKWLEDNESVLGFESRFTAAKLLRLANVPLAAHLSEPEAVSISRQIWGHAPAPTIEPPSKEILQDPCESADLHDLADSGRKFGTIYADPPWEYDNRATRSAVDTIYKGTMTAAEVAEMPIEKLAADEAHLHLWTTNAFLFDCQEIIKAWGFEYKGVFVWIKPTIGIGNYWRVSHEFLLLGVRGGLTFKDHSLMSWLLAERGEHSVKPDKVRMLIERASPGPRIELFARRCTEGWAVWGNEIERDMFTREVATL